MIDSSDQWISQVLLQKRQLNSWVLVIINIIDIWKNWEKIKRKDAQDPDFVALNWQKSKNSYIVSKYTNQ